jgi:hypothetical protein
MHASRTSLTQYARWGPLSEHSDPFVSIPSQLQLVVVTMRSRARPMFLQVDTLQRKQLTILEVRLNKLKIRDAEADHHNEGLKKEINDLRKSRMVINHTHKKVSEGWKGLQVRRGGADSPLDRSVMQYEGWLQKYLKRIHKLLVKANRANREREQVS